jgi:hypothetical protein
MIPAAVATLVFIGTGFLTLFWPRRVQEFAVWLYEKIGFWPLDAGSENEAELLHRSAPDHWFGVSANRFGLRLDLVGRPGTMMFDQKSNQAMKPTAPRRNKYSVFATTPCRGLSLSR